VRLLLVALAAGLGAWLVRRGRRPGPRQVTVAWQDGSELELDPGAPGQDRLVAIAAKVVG
jgi:hypothetical protein